jgi:predicted enzyme related to lactoylglutathione lyase
MTSDYAAAFDFYSQLFGWTVINDMDMGPMGTYRIFGLGERQMGGMMTIPKGAPMPTCWMY